MVAYVLGPSEFRLGVVVSNEGLGLGVVEVGRLRDRIPVSDVALRVNQWRNVKIINLVLGRFCGRDGLEQAVVGGFHSRPLAAVERNAADEHGNTYRTFGPVKRTTKEYVR